MQFGFGAALGFAGGVLVTGWALRGGINEIKAYVEKLIAGVEARIVLKIEGAQPTAPTEAKKL